MPNNIGVVGDRESVLAFRMLGFDVHFATEAKEARRIIDKLAEKNYGVVYLTEQLAELIPETIRRYDAKMTPAVILIPNHAGSRGIGKKRVQENVEKAVGQNIL
ncbi:V-type ATP synthase subunit F [Marinilactibacillus psychrotolerans]|uniref:V-type ATP synthase subunit F n=2 Tax=Marinilactibacillus psychrotolerans TaxID=191770 RepID=A0A511GY38_9LACT|nr:V-type ATP synthase subunit F [Marinilactibacillus psychrotolerans]TLQ08534.1 V-type ATP synthase subunit F [Marinilactibacillus psychrotolerans]SDB95447.1 V/A-type H+-transporting ATPase subunit F [Marinilactibacillus psychrotolerans]SJN35092.1 V-type ATP synthase subunit F [Marinilactibacillus psychrotolerans 42ea]GEL66181.1 V-type ATP synthase subunit F [Marinilactibacillus psychrotolerans]GEQ32945.1 V-type ATP synthase subunit F [Marinilactibacillus psychrotolerans]